MIKKTALLISILFFSNKSFANGLEAMSDGLAILAGYVIVLCYSVCTMLFINAKSNMLVMSPCIRPEYYYEFSLTQYQNPGFSCP